VQRSSAAAWRPPTWYQRRWVSFSCLFLLAPRDRRVSNYQHQQDYTVLFGGGKGSQRLGTQQSSNSKLDGRCPDTAPPPARYSSKEWRFSAGCQRHLLLAGRARNSALDARRCPAEGRGSQTPELQLLHICFTGAMGSSSRRGIATGRADFAQLFRGECSCWCTQIGNEKPLDCDKEIYFTTRSQQKTEELSLQTGEQNR
jgi:hypothetical protein